jgi:hypothetical protein
VDLPFEVAALGVSGRSGGGTAWVPLFSGAKNIMHRSSMHATPPHSLTHSLTSNHSLHTTYCLRQCCGSGRFLTGSGSDFRKRLDPDPDPDHNKFSANFFQKMFLDENML